MMRSEQRNRINMFKPRRCWTALVLTTVVTGSFILTAGIASGQLNQTEQLRRLFPEDNASTNQTGYDVRPVPPMVHNRVTDIYSSRQPESGPQGGTQIPAFRAGVDSSVRPASAQVEFAAPGNQNPMAPRTINTNNYVAPRVAPIAPVSFQAERQGQQHQIDLSGYSAETIRNVSYVARRFQQQDDPQLPPLPTQPGQQEQQEINLQIPDTRGEVRFFFDPVSQKIIIRADFPEDAEIARKFLAEYLSAVSENPPTTQSFALTTALAEDVIDDIRATYEERFQAGNGAARIVANPPSGIIVTGSQGAIDAVRELINSYNATDFDPDAPKDFRTYNLRHMSALDAANRVQAFLRRDPALLVDGDAPSTPASVIPDFRSNSLIVRAGESVLLQIDRLIQEIDVAEIPDGPVSIVRVFPVRNVVATDLAQVIQDAINGQLANAGLGNIIQSSQQTNNNAGAQNQPQQQQPGTTDDQSSILASTQLELQTIGGNGLERVRGGIMFDVRVTADPNSNSLVVRGPESSMDLIEALIDRLDQVPDGETQIKVFQIINGDATQLLNVLSVLFTGQAPGGGGAAAATNQLVPLQSSSAIEGSTLINLRFAVDARTNTIIASGSPGDLDIVFDLVTRLDEQNGDTRDTFVYRLSNASALDVETALLQWLTDREAQAATDPTYTGALLLARRQVLIRSVDASNHLIVTAAAEAHIEIERVIRALDRRPPMVKVKVLLAEVDLDALEEFGIDIGLQSSLTFDRGVAEGIGFNFNQTGIGNANVMPSVLGAQAISNLGVGRSNAGAGFGGLVLSAGNESVSLLLRALKDRSCVNILSKPQVMTIENLRGTIFVGESVSRVTSANQAQLTGVTTNQLDERDVGIQLDITPRVSPDGMIVMFVDVAKEALGAEADGAAVSVSATGEIVRQANITRSFAQTTIMARHGQTVVFSGLIQEQKEQFVRGTPILSDLPVVGPLFRFEGESTSRSELMIILTPYIVSSDEAIDLHNREEMDRIHWCMCDVAEVYGSTSYTGANINSTPMEVVYPDLGRNGSPLPNQLNAPPAYDEYNYDDSGFGGNAQPLDMPIPGQQGFEIQPPFPQQR